MQNIRSARFFQTAGFYEEVVLDTLDYFAGQVSGRALGFASGRLVTFIPWFAKVYFEHQSQLARHPGWALKNWRSWNPVEDALKCAAIFEPGLHVALIN